MLDNSSPTTMLDRKKRKRRMALVFGLTTAYMLAEAAGGFLTGGLALIADAGHMLTDAGALGLALFAMSYAERPATAEKSFGFYRAEVLAAFSNAALLLLTVGHVGKALALILANTRDGGPAAQYLHLHFV